MATGAEVAETAIDKAADVAEIVSEESSHIAEATRGVNPRDVGLLFGGLGIGLVGGFIIGGLVMNKKMSLKYEAIADEEISLMREHYNNKLVALESREEKKTLGELSEKLEYATEGDGKVAYHKVGTEPEKTKNVFADPPIVDVEVEEDVYKMERDPEVPYIIHKEEFDATPDGYDQYTLTYFEGDDVLSDERDKVIEDQDNTVGLENLNRFGQGSGDPNIVYVRNEKLKVDIEVVHSDGKFAQEVHGFEDSDLQHSSMRRRSPRRSDYGDSD